MIEIEDVNPRWDDKTSVRREQMGNDRLRQHNCSL